MVADGRSLDVVDYEVDQVQRYPIGETPLSVLLDPDAELAKFAKVKMSNDDILVIEARDRKNPEYGIITMYFERQGSAPGDLLLSGWNVVDAAGQHDSRDAVGRQVQRGPAEECVPLQGPARPPAPTLAPRLCGSAAGLLAAARMPHLKIASWNINSVRARMPIVAQLAREGAA